MTGLPPVEDAEGEPAADVAPATDDGMADEDEVEETDAQKKRKQRMSIAELKQAVAHPEVVEMHDGNSHEPVLLCHLKGYRNLVPVPKHWSQKRRYLQNRRGFLKPPFTLPQFILDTGNVTLCPGCVHVPRC